MLLTAYNTPKGVDHKDQESNTSSRSDGTFVFDQGDTNMGDKGSKDKGKREQQKKAQLTPKEKRKLKREKKKS